MLLLQHPTMMMMMMLTTISTTTTTTRYMLHLSIRWEQMKMRNKLTIRDRRSWRGVARCHSSALSDVAAEKKCCEIDTQEMIIKSVYTHTYIYIHTHFNNYLLSIEDSNSLSVFQYTLLLLFIDCTMYIMADATHLYHCIGVEWNPHFYYYYNYYDQNLYLLLLSIQLPFD